VTGGVIADTGPLSPCCIGESEALRFFDLGGVIFSGGGKADFDAPFLGRPGFLFSTGVEASACTDLKGDGVCSALAPDGDMFARAAAGRPSTTMQSSKSSSTSRVLWRWTSITTWTLLRGDNVLAFFILGTAPVVCRLRFLRLAAPPSL
jgi:hypothetical protein